MKFIEKQTYGGMDWHDSTSRSVNLKENGTFSISDPQQVISADLWATFMELDRNYACHVLPSKEAIGDALKSGKHICAFAGEKCGNDGPYETSMVYDPSKEELLEEYLFGQITYHTYYVVKDIPMENVRYLAYENFLCPNKGVPSVTRFYSLPVKTEQEAERQLEKLSLHVRDDKSVWADSVKELVVFDVDVLPNTLWYALNVQAIREEEEIRGLLEKRGLSAELPFRMYSDQHIEELHKFKDKLFNPEVISCAG